MKDYKITIIGLILGMSIFISSIAFDIEFFEIFISQLQHLEEYELDEFIIPFFIIIIFVTIDLFQRVKKQHIEHEKVKIYTAMLSSTHHILNNFLNHMQLFKVEAEDTPTFDSEILSMYDETIKDVSSQIEALSSITEINEDSISYSVKPF